LRFALIVDLVSGLTGIERVGRFRADDLHHLGDAEILVQPHRTAAAPGHAWLGGDRLLLRIPSPHLRAELPVFALDPHDRAVRLAVCETGERQGRPFRLFHRQPEAHAQAEAIADALLRLWGLRALAAQAGAGEATTDGEGEQSEPPSKGSVARVILPAGRL